MWHGQDPHSQVPLSSLRSLLLDYEQGLAANELHLCGDGSAVDLVRRMAKDMKEPLEVRYYDRFSPLRVNPFPFLPCAWTLSFLPLLQSSPSTSSVHSVTSRGGCDLVFLPEWCGHVHGLLEERDLERNSFNTFVLKPLLPAFC